MFETQVCCPVPATRSALPRMWWIRLGCLAWLLSAVGCFEKTYADRMAVTVKLYEHIDLLNRNLNPDWADGGFKLRTPLGFKFIPKPVPPPRDPKDPVPAPGTEEPLDDPRQPGYLGIKLPGMVAAWSKNVSVDEPQTTTTRKAYIYLLSNVALFAVSPEEPGRIDPLKFQEHTVNLLAGDLGVQFKEEDWRREDFPVDFKLVPKVTYDRMDFVPPERMFEETKMTFKLFITSQKDTQAILLIVYPDLTSSSERLSERIPLCLETLQIPDNAAAASTGAPAAGGGGGNAPAF
ncbi:MAG: hypothetical protein JWN70_3958 [Planctomycetaceae bacterium]|nr:hypothetical protein [Planctomycetaceae bacterium]